MLYNKFYGTYDENDNLTVCYILPLPASEFVIGNLMLNTLPCLH